MKSILKSLTVLIFVFGFLSSNAGEDKRFSGSSLLSPVKTKKSSSEMTEGGFFFHIGGLLPTRSYMIPVAFTSNDLDDLYEDGDFPKYGLGVDFEVGNMFRIVDLDPMAIGLRGTWLTANLATRRYNDTIAIRTLSASFLRIGPSFTYAISDIMAVDLFYQIGPQFSLSLDHNWSESSGEVLGASHEVGLGYRLDKLSIILGYKFGNLRDLDATPAEMKDPELRDFRRARTGAIRFAVGIKI